MEIPLKARILCSDGQGGAVAGALVQADGRSVTHVIAREEELSLVRRLIPLDAIMETTSDTVRTRLTSSELGAQPALDEVTFLTEVEPTNLALPGGQLAELPVAIPKPPPGALIMDHGIPVDATDHHIGGLDALLIDPLNGVVTHVIVREGHLWNKREVTIPASNVTRFDEDGLNLDLTRAKVEQLPTTKV